MLYTAVYHIATEGVNQRLYRLGNFQDVIYYAEQFA